MKRVLIVLGIIVSIISIIIACYPEDGIDGIDGVDGIDGIDGVNCWDLNGNGIGDADEDKNEDGVFDAFDCQGEDGYSVVTKISEASSCDEGGYAITFGLDVNRNKILDDDEPILHTMLVCNNPSGLNTLFETIPVLDDDVNRCPSGNGGWEIWSGLDINRNGTLDEDERTGSFIICNGADGAIGQSVLYAIEQTEGGVVISLGYDTNGDGVLGETEIIDTITISNGTDGADGSDGSSGTDGQTVLVEMEKFGPSETCPVGGTRIFVGYDTDGDGALSSDEILEVTEICDGIPGTDGADGADGADGTDGVDAPVSYFVYETIQNFQAASEVEMLELPASKGDYVFRSDTLTAFEMTGDDSTLLGSWTSIAVDNVCEIGGVRVFVYDDVDGDGALNKDVDFFLEAHSLCYGMTIGQALAVGYELDDFFDIDINISEGNEKCPTNPDATTVIVVMENVELITFVVCPGEVP